MKKSTILVTCLMLVTVVFAEKWPGFSRGMGIGGWLTNYKRFNVLSESQRGITPGDLAHFEDYICAADLYRIKTWGFDHIRLAFDQIVVEETPGKWREATMKKLVNTAKFCKKNKLNLVLNLHKAVGNYCDIAEKESLLDSPDLQKRFINVWLEIERRLKDYPEVAFELLNEVRDVPNPQKWNELADKTIKAIREKNPTRWIVVGSTAWGSPQKLAALKIWDDPYVVYTFHMYAPFDFTHQRGVLQASPHYQNRVVPSPSREEIKKHLKPALDWAAAHPDKILWSGEFGTIRHISPIDRANYMRDVVAVCKEAGIPWCVWNYLSTPYDGNRFSLVDDDTRDFLSDDLLLACLGEGDAAERGEFRYMSFNIWGDYPGFRNPYYERDLKLATYLLNSAPDIVGMQEVNQKIWKSRLFKKLLPHYGIIEMGKSANGKFNPLLWRKDRFNCLESGSQVFAEKDNPEKSKGFGWGVFEDKVTKRKLISYSTHFWWKHTKKEDDEMRVRNGKEIITKIKELQEKYGNCSVVGGGDLNCTFAQKCEGINTPLSAFEEIGLLDAQYSVKKSSKYSTHHGYPYRDDLKHFRGYIYPTAMNPSNSLDHVHYSTNTIEPLSLFIDRSQLVMEASDHSPVIFTFRIKDDAK